MSDYICDVVCIGAHPDDVEIGMGGTVAGLVRSGARVAIVDLTNGEPTPHGSVETRACESAAAARVLGVERRTLTQSNRYLVDTVEARIELAEVIRELRPRILFVPYPVDAHPDHVAAAAISVAARFYSKFTKTEMAHAPVYPERVFRYMAVHQRQVIEPSFIIDITEDLPRKLEALREYRSQFVVNERNADVIPFVESTARMWGTLGRVGAGEPFFALEPLTLATPLDIL
jgi:bacillithiol biosynthesis deacetylase BshB1